MRPLFHGPLPRLDVSDALDFNRRAAGQVLHGNRRAGRRIRGKVGVVDLIHGCEICDVGEEHRTLQDLVHRRAGGFQNRLQVFQALFHLIANRPLDHLVGLGSWAPDPERKSRFPSWVAGLKREADVSGSPGLGDDLFLGR